MGLATAKLLASRGASISLADINEDMLKSAIASLPGGQEKHAYFKVDVRQSGSVDAWIAATMARFSRIDGAVNMAGIISPATPITELSEEVWDREFAVNTRGVFLCLRAQLRAMKETGGSIVGSGGEARIIDNGKLTDAGVCRFQQRALLARWARQVWLPTALVRQR